VGVLVLNPPAESLEAQYPAATVADIARTGRVVSRLQLRAPPSVEYLDLGITVEAALDCNRRGGGPALPSSTTCEVARTPTASRQPCAQERPAPRRDFRLGRGRRPSHAVAARFEQGRVLSVRLGLPAARSRGLRPFASCQALCACHDPTPSISCAPPHDPRLLLPRRLGNGAGSSRSLTPNSVTTAPSLAAPAREPTRSMGWHRAESSCV